MYLQGIGQEADDWSWVEEAWSEFEEPEAAPAVVDTTQPVLRPQPKKLAIGLGAIAAAFGFWWLFLRNRA